MYQRKTKRYPYIGTLTEESKLREQAWIRHGCNAYDATNKTSQPMSFWSEHDVLHYIYEEGLEIASVYGDIVAVDDKGYEYEPFFASGCNLKCTGCSRTGCVFCGFGVHLEKGETKEAALIREVREETGLILRDFKYRGDLVFINDDYQEIMYLYTSDNFSGSLKECDEGELMWVKKDKLLSLNLWEGDRVFLKKMIETFFSPF